MSAQIEGSQRESARFIHIQRRCESAGNVAQQNGKGSSAEELREEVAQGFLYTHSRANVNSSTLLEVASFSYALIEMLDERGLINIDELNQKREQVNKRLAERFAGKGMGVALTKEEEDEDGTVLNVEIDCENRLFLCHAACCRFRFALTVRDVEEGNVKWNLGQPYMIRQVDGYCFHFDREHQHCGIYEKRPFVCRAYDCRKDKRIWQDFENRIISPEIENLVTRLTAPGASAEQPEAEGDY
jgi:hypothetical protein